MSKHYTIPIEELRANKGVDFPASVKFRQLLITGPPGSGKTTLINKLGGWSEEGYIDLSMPKWWTAQSLAIRPREIHLGIPFVGVAKALSVYDEEWVQSPAPLSPDLERIVVPPAKRFFFSVDWRARYVLEFLLPPPDSIFGWRSERSRRGTHYVDADLTLKLVENQVETYWLVAQHLHRNGMSVYIREGVDGRLRRFVDSDI